MQIENNARRMWPDFSYLIILCIRDFENRELAIFQPYRDSEAGDNQSLKISKVWNDR